MVVSMEDNMHRMHSWYADRYEPTPGMYFQYFIAS